MPRIVISYRRADSAAISGRIFDRLTHRYGAEKIFMDIDEIPFGIDFREHIAGVLATCDAVVAVIGPRWVTGGSPTARIVEETDPVRIEVQAALERGVPVIPVLVEGAAMPEPSELPPPLVDLAYRNACEVSSGRDFHAHVDRLIRAIDRMFPEGGAERPDQPAPLAMATLMGAHGASALAEHAPGRSSPSASAPAPAARAGMIRTLLLTAFLVLPQAVQFTMRTELFVLALVISTIGVVAIVDDESEKVTARLVKGIVAALGNMVIQGALGVARASLLPW
jgi:hypothetical protein